MPPGRVPDDGRELPTEVAAEVVSVPLVEVREDLGVAMAREPVALGTQGLTEVEVVVELAVLRGDDRPVLVHDGLMTTGDVDDRETPNADRDARRDVRA
jgi:hypothetical protein